MHINKSFVLHSQSCLIVGVMAFSMASKGQGDFSSHWHGGCEENFLKAGRQQVISCEMRFPMYQLSYKYWGVWIEILYALDAQDQIQK